MKKVINITLIVGIIINIVVNLLVSESGLNSLLLLYVYFPICFLAVSYGFKSAGVEDSVWVATVINAPVFLGFIGMIFSESNIEFAWQWMCRTPLFAILLSIIILEYKIFDLFLE